MRKLIIILLLCSNTCFCQQVKLPVDSVTGNVAYTDVVKADSTLSANELYKRAHAWFTETYKSSKEVIQNADNETHTISGKAIMPGLKTILYSPKVMMLQNPLT